MNIPRRRRCQNPYRNCPNFAVKQEGRSYVSKLCPECLQRRRQKQATTASQPNCRCGNKMSIGATQCRGCDWKDSELQRGIDARRERLKADLAYIAETDPQAIEDAFNSLMQNEIRSLQRDYP